ncbi:uncharacterized protein LOC106866273 isoform X1 [Brachypodium distachyon]|uniref:PARP catalytic domain-containing protein n=1 Tax=Brachypodium distachyon TaxID=15368 RepID=A0A0Q3IDF1_BRADI|nr:uncharacterized protein LOC106866273 isoform X1 [Brachypodium distachyon]XP_014755278.1 uncharacterized protein LOC106866273 isoform X1 [Brachypodium distachyon]XP_024315204.1 uncharacterized protein LOC106866273 isoform X1 [Brachypodium distachyon]XP_024315205.1 uncharacterized protein LOC106866273 isoform X1 [Brachypodium distachyon]KQK03930.1 hypothetical protein BRADI_2g10720v3 [Brachypodium distachyon]KQK03931.1 hypothetical protein BRADI_2g10720v3 [Brachypodium distachyon]PNT70352.1 |eukprot:XP_014755277.1 uncharacterized protein LOC106866273 isoform X1 [Brachypodium distachyon]
MGESSPSSLPQQWRAFCSSGPPVYLKIDGEQPYAAEGLVAEDFSDGKAVIEAELPCGRLLLFDFLGRRCVDLNDTSKSYHMCWVDASHQVYGNATEHPALPLPRDMEDSSSLRHQWRQFRRSGFPRAIAIDGEGGARTAVPCKVIDFVATAFAIGKAVVEARLPEGRAVLFDFLRKVIVDLDEPSNKSPIRWVDNQQRVFANEPVLGIDEHKVTRAFTEGTSGRFNITCIEKCLVHRIEAFKANIYPQPLVYGWYGGLVSDVKEAAYGSGVVNINSTLLAAGRAHGNAAHVSPMSQPYESAMLAEVDTKGEAHLLFCSIALGRQEVIPAGSLQNSPTGKPYDTGVDNKFYPSWYIFGSGWMHNQIVPLYVLSFIKNPVLTPGLSPFGVYDEIQKSLPPSDLQAVERCCNVYMKNQINTPQFVKERQQQPRERPDNSCSIAIVTPEVRTAKRRRGSGATVLGRVPAVDPGRPLLNPDPQLGSVDPESGTCDPGFHTRLLCQHGTASNPSHGVPLLAEETGDSSQSSLPWQWRQLCSSGLPVEVKIEGDRPCRLAGLEKAFDQGKAIFEVQYRGRRMLFDFLEKRCVNLDDPSKNYRMRWTDRRRKVYWNTTEPAADSSASSLRQQWDEFCRSGPPTSISVKLKGDTRFIPRATIDSIAATFTEKIAIVEVQIMPSGQRVLFVFLRKVIIDLDEPFKKWNISWVTKIIGSSRTNLFYGPMSKW